MASRLCMETYDRTGLCGSIFADVPRAKYIRRSLLYPRGFVSTGSTCHKPVHEIHFTKHFASWRRPHSFARHSSLCQRTHISKTFSKLKDCCPKRARTTQQRRRPGDTRITRCLCLPYGNGILHLYNACWRLFVCGVRSSRS